MEGDLQELADQSAKKSYVVDDMGNLVNPSEVNEPPKGELEETKEAADELEDQFQMPTRLKNMKKADLAQSYVNLEQEKSRLGNELGDLRKQVDELLKAPAVERKPIEAEQLLEDPDATLNNAISENDKLKALESRVEQFESTTVKNSFYQQHPDADNIVTSPEFSEYLQMTPIAAKATAIASQSGDYSTLGDVLDSFKAFKGKAIKEESQQKREQQLNDAQLESGSTGGSSRKVYKRSDLIQERIRNPERYAANEAEYLAAYAEGRVK